MSSILTEPSTAGLPLSLQQGINQLASGQTLTFTRYARVVVSQDGFVYWVNAGAAVTAQGSLHYATSQEQEEDQTLGVNSILFTTAQQITQFNAASDDSLWIADWTTPGGDVIQIAFSRQGPYFPQSQLWHYAGFAVYPALASQLIQSLADLPTGPIVSDSLPIWLALPTSLAAVIGAQAPVVPVYASFLIPSNIVPPYIAAHVEPGGTKALQPFPSYNWSGVNPVSGVYALPDSQLMQDMVRLTFYGLTNQQARQWLSALIQYSLDTDAFGFQTPVAFQDEKRTQSEITAIAMKKTLTLRVSYYQSTADALARRLILSASLGALTT